MKQSSVSRSGRSQLVSIVLLGVLMLLVGACSVPPPSAPVEAIPPTATPQVETVPTALPSPTETATLEPTPTPPTAVSEAGEPQPSPTSLMRTPMEGEVVDPDAPTPLPIVDPAVVVPDAAIQIRRPGALSKVTSPLRVVANLRPGYEDKVLIELIGEDGQPIFRETREVNFPSGYQTVDIAEDIAFDIPTVAEAARLRLSVQDEYGRTTAVGSVTVVLFSEGRSTFNIVTDYREELYIQSPFPEATVKGGILFVSGFVRPQTSLPLEIELVDRNGNVVGKAEAPVIIEAGASYGLFVAEVPYAVVRPTWALLSVREVGDRIPGTIHLSSIEVVLDP
ncbi:MAG: hypothetical protein ACK2T5_09935 [Anaerolineales bacterium]